jgi:hypothetical protein
MMSWAFVHVLECQRVFKGRFFLYSYLIILADKRFIYLYSIYRFQISEYLFYNYYLLFSKK